MAEIERRDQDVSRLWKHVNVLEVTVERHDRAVAGLSYTIYGVPEVPGTGLAHELPKRVAHVEEQLARVTRYLGGLLATALLAVVGEIVVRLATGG